MPTEIVDPVRRQRMSFSSEGDALHAEVWTAPGGDVPAHYHPQQTERFEVVSGEVVFRVGRDRRRAGPGDRVIAEPGVVHAFRNSGAAAALVRVEVQPALRLQAFLEEAVRSPARASTTGSACHAACVQRQSWPSSWSGIRT